MKDKGILDKGILDKPVVWYKTSGSQITAPERAKAERKEWQVLGTVV